MMDNTAIRDEIFGPPFMHTALNVTPVLNYRLNSEQHPPFSLSLPPPRIHPLLLTCKDARHIGYKRLLSVSYREGSIRTQKDGRRKSSLHCA